MNAKWLLVQYESSPALEPKERELSPYGVLDSGVRKGRIKLFVFDAPLESEHIEELRIKVKVSDGGVVVYPAKHHPLIKDVFSKVLAKRFMSVDETGEDWASAQEVFFEEFLGLVKSPPSKENISLRVFSLAEEDANSKEEETMPVEQIIRQFWDKDPALKRILLHAYLLHRQSALGTPSIFNDLRRRVGLKPAKFGAHISMLEYQEVIERGGTCFLRTDNGAYEAVERFVIEEYKVDQVLNGMTGTEFLSTAYDGRRAQAKRFSDTVKGVLLKRLPYLRYINLSSNPDIFELFLPGKWFAVFLCQTRSTPLGERSVAMALSYKEKLNRWLVMKSSFAIVCGPAFSEASRSLAQGTNVFLLEAAGFLKINDFLFSLEQEQRIAMHDYFPLIFSLGAGLIPVEKALSVVFQAMEEG